jgi:hypothetical protein
MGKPLATYEPELLAAAIILRICDWCLEIGTSALLQQFRQAAGI